MAVNNNCARSSRVCRRKCRKAAAVALALVVGVSMPTSLRAQAPGPVLPEMMTPPAAKAIERGLRYLVTTQRRDGSWLNQGSEGAYPAVMTSLAGLALMAGGSTPEAGPYARNVSKALNYILRVAESHDDGLIAGPGGETRSMYGHGFSMLFLAQAYGMELSEEQGKRVKSVLDKAVRLTVRSQSDLGKAANHAGGWIYTPSGNSDEGSVTVTQLQALRACRNVGVKVPTSTIDRAVAYLKYCQMTDGGICYSASSRGSSRPPISAAAIACFYAAGVYDQQTGGKGEEAEMVEKLVGYVKQHVKVSGQEYGGLYHYFYAHLYMAQAMYQRGGGDWKDYYPRIMKDMIRRQAPDGSWNDGSVGTCYGTAIATIILQLPYGYLPICHR